MRYTHSTPMGFKKRFVPNTHSTPIQFAFFFLSGLTLYVYKYSVNYVYILSANAIEVPFLSRI